MAEASGFAESNDVIGAPAGMEDSVECLSILRAMLPGDVPVIFSAWRVSAEELAEITRTGRIWVMTLGVSMSPLEVLGIKPFCTMGDIDGTGSGPEAG